MIEGTVKKVNAGSGLLSNTSEAFSKVTASSAKVGDLVGEIAAASDEQARGIEQVNTAVSEMDKITQQNAANAEESASASEEMNTQAEQIKEMVRELVTLIEGASNRNASLEVYQAEGRSKPYGSFGPNPKPEIKSHYEANSQQIIPLNETDF
jgi:methyl-accepting chemotaxis protein